MRQVVIGVTALLLCMPFSIVRAQSQSQLTRWELMLVVNTIISFRGDLRDSTPVDFCRVPEFWDEQGRFVQPSYADRVKYRLKSECPPPGPLPSTVQERRVTILSLKFTGDTLVEVHSRTQDREFAMLESYSISNVRGVPRSATYCILGVQNH